MLASAFFSFAPIVSSEPAIIISDYELTPSVLMPGDEAILNVTLYNSETSGSRTTQELCGGLTITNVGTSGANIQKISVISASDGNYDISATSYYSNVGRIASGASIPISFAITSNKNMREGWYFPKVKVDLESSSLEDLNYPIPVRVSNETIDLIEAQVPSQISISGETDITLNVVNHRETPVNAVTIFPIEVEDIEIMPKNKFLGTISSQTSEDVSFSVIPIEKGQYNLTFNLTYKNGVNKHNSSLTFSIDVVDSLDVAPVLYSVPSTVGKGQSGRIRIEVYNAKTEEISGVVVTPANTNVTVSPAQYFIGSMDPDDVYSASFEIDSDSLEIGEEYSIDFKVTFKQGENYYETPSVNAGFKVVEPVIVSDGTSVCYATIFIIVIIIVIIVLFYFIRKRRTAR